MAKKPIYALVLLLICLSIDPIFGRVPPRNSPVNAEETPAVDAAKPEDSATESSPVERTPVSESADSDESSLADKPRKPIGVILFRTQPQISIFRDRSPFGPSFGSELHPFPSLHSPHFGLGNRFGHDDPAIRLLSILFGDRRLRPLGPTAESGETDSVNASSESTETTDRHDVHPFEGMFPNIFIPRFPSIDAEKEGEPSSTNDEKTPANFENKEKKVIHIGGRKFVKTTQTKKVKNDFGEFHSVISSYQPFDEKLHDENGNEKPQPEESSVDKKDVNKEIELTTKPSESSSVEPAVSASSTQAPPTVEKEETPDLKVKAEEPEEKKPESLKVDESKNEIPDKAEIKVDQMN